MTSESIIEMEDHRSQLPESDAFVFFGASGDLAYKRIFPALHNMVRHGTLTGSVIGVHSSAADRIASVLLAGSIQLSQLARESFVAQNSSNTWISEEGSMAAFCGCCGAEITSKKAEACPVCGMPTHGMLQADSLPALETDGEASQPETAGSDVDIQSR